MMLSPATWSSPGCKLSGGGNGGPLAGICLGGNSFCGLFLSRLKTDIFPDELDKARNQIHGKMVIE
jgi:hypothetical protein